MKRTLTLIPALALAATTLVSCSSDGTNSSGSPSDLGFECAPSGSVSDNIEVTGEHGEEVKITADTPANVKKQETKLIDQGDGRDIESGDAIGVTISLFDGETGDAVTSETNTIGIQEDQIQAWIGNALACGGTQSRVVSVAPVSAIWEDVTSTGFDMLKQDGSVIMVFDALGAQPGETPPEDMLDKAEGTAKSAPADYPTVALSDTGEQTITIPEGVEAPEKLEVGTLIEGDGETVQPGDRVWVTYRGVIWRTGEEFDSSWSRGEPTSFTTTGVIGGFKEALEGQKVGSQVISIVPAEDGGYGGDWLEQNGHERDDVMVFVLDILATAHVE